MDEPLHPLPVGRAELLREGDDVAILALGAMVLPAERAADALAAEGIAATVVNARFVKPLDERLILDLAARCRAIVTVEENVIAGGFGSAVLELLAREGVQTPVRCLGITDRIWDHGSQGSLRKQTGLSVEHLTAPRSTCCLFASRQASPDRDVSTLQETLDRLGITLPAGAIASLEHYRDLLLDANRRINLTAITNPDEVDERLIAESLLLLPLIPPDATTLLDVGTGGGVPGLPLAIARPDLQVTLLDATEKKVRFLTETVSTLGLERVTTLRGRAEELGHAPRTASATTWLPLVPSPGSQHSRNTRSVPARRWRGHPPEGRRNCRRTGRGSLRRRAARWPRAPAACNAARGVVRRHHRQAARHADHLPTPHRRGVEVTTEAAPRRVVTTNPY